MSLLLCATTSFLTDIVLKTVFLPRPGPFITLLKSAPLNVINARKVWIEEFLVENTLKEFTSPSNIDLSFSASP